MKVILIMLFIAAFNCIYKQPAYPAWAHSHWVWINSASQNQERIVEMVAEYLKRNISVGAVDVDSKWSTKLNNFNWDLNKFPNPTKMITDFHNANIKVILWITSIINNDSQDFQEAKSKGYLLSDGQTINWWRGTGAFIDYRNKQGVAWWHKKMDKALDMDIDGWKCDGSDPLIIELLPYAYSKHRWNPVSYREYSNHYYGDTFNYTRTKKSNSLIMARAVDNEFIRPLHLSYAPTYVSFSAWVGDFDSTYQGFRLSLTDVLHSAWRGYLNVGLDIGGYGGDITKSLLIRFAQVGALLPLMQNGGNGNHFPWLYDEQCVEIYRKFVNIHLDLLPYFLTTGTEAFLKGKSSITPLNRKLPSITFQKIKNFQYLLGSDILICPVLDDSGVATCQFPNNDWIYYFNTSKKFLANSRVSLFFPLGQVGVFMKKGSIIPHINKLIWVYPSEGNTEKTFYNDGFNDDIIVQFNTFGLTLTVQRFYSPQTAPSSTNDTIQLIIIGASKYLDIQGKFIIKQQYEENSLHIQMFANSTIIIKGLIISG